MLLLGNEFNSGGSTIHPTDPALLSYSDKVNKHCIRFIRLLSVKKNLAVVGHDLFKFPVLSPFYLKFGLKIFISLVEVKIVW